MVRLKRPWSLLSSHGLVLVTIVRFGDLTVPQICEKTGLSRSTVLNVLKDLKTSQILIVRRTGRRNTYQLSEDATFRHQIMADTHISELFKAFPALNS
jgi:hypothetical protein